MQLKLTEREVADLQPQSDNYDVWDTELPGFVVRVSHSGLKPFRLVYRHAGQRKPFTIGRYGKVTVAQARDIARRTAAQVALGNDVQAEKVAARLEAKKKSDEHTLNSFVDGPFADWRRANSRHPEDSLKRLRGNFFKDLGSTRLAELTLWQVDKWKAKRLKSGAKPETVNRDLNELKAALSRAVDWKLLPISPISKLKPLKTDNSAKVRYLDEPEEVALRAAMVSRDGAIREGRASGNQWRLARGYQLMPDLSGVVYPDHLTPMVLLSMNTGVRQGELFKLMWEDVDLKRRLLTVRGIGAKSLQTRHIPLNNESVAALSSWLPDHKGARKGLVFPSENSKPFDDVKTAWATLLKRADIKSFRWHDLRHHFASQLIMAGVDLNTVRELLGHKDIKTTLRYAHLAPEHKAEAVSRLSQGKGGTPVLVALSDLAVVSEDQ